MGKYNSLEFALHHAAREFLVDFEFFESGERYGAYQWAWTKMTGDRRVSVILAAEDAEGPAYRAINLEVWAAADEENRFGRSKVAELFAVPVESGDDKRLWFSLRFLLGAARLRAEEMGFHELTDRYHKTPDHPPLEKTLNGIEQVERELVQHLWEEHNLSAKVAASRELDLKGKKAILKTLGLWKE